MKRPGCIVRAIRIKKFYSYLESFAFTRKVSLFARGSPTRGAGEEPATRLRGCTKDSLPVRRRKAPAEGFFFPSDMLYYNVF